jgi:DNA-directed RNA polymerase subunit RPC12/RpoP
MSAWKFKEYEKDIMSDELVKEALHILEKKYDKMSNWIKENKSIDSCPKCDSKNLEYKHNGIVCNDCNHKVEIKVPYPAKGGVCASRKLESIIKELFSSKMNKQIENEKPPTEMINNLPFDINSFDTGEYTKEQANYLKNRYSTLIEQNNITNEVDKFYVRSLVVRELKLFTLERQIAIGEEVESVDLKREYKIYDDLASKLKANKASRGDNDEESFFADMEKVIEGEEIEEMIKKYYNNSEREEYLKKSKKRREEAGNPY